LRDGYHTPKDEKQKGTEAETQVGAACQQFVIVG